MLYDPVHTSMAVYKSTLSIRAAVMNCLARCIDSQAPLCCLGEFLEKLVAMGWSEDDIQIVQASVLHLLGRSNIRQHSDARDASLTIR